MKDKGKAVTGMLRKDIVLLVVFLLAALGISCFVLNQVLTIVERGTARTAIIVVFSVAMLALAGSMAWVAVHLRKNKNEVYGEDLDFQNLIRQQKEDSRL